MHHEIPKTIAPRFDRGRHSRGRIGFVILATEPLLESEMIKIAPPDIGVHFSRVAMADELTAENLMDQLSKIPQAASLLLADGQLDVLCYACTSGSIVMGEAQIVECLRAGMPGAIPTTLISCVLAAFRKLNINKIAVATPYIPEINDRLRAYLAGSGVDVVNIGGLELTRDIDIAHVDPRFLIEFAKHVDRPDAEAIFLSCSALRASEVAAEIEEQVGKPVVTSNQAMLWNCLRLANVSDKFGGYGRLFLQ